MHVWVMKVTMRTPVGCKYTRASRQTFSVARVAFPMAPIVDGERAGRLANMMFGAKHGGHHHQEVRINVVEFTSSDIALQLN